MNPPFSERILVVNQRHHAATDTNPGTEEKPLRTIQGAARLAHPGDAVHVHAGEYRETVTPPRGGEAGWPITYRAAPGEQVFIKGSDIYRGEWHSYGPVGVYVAKVPVMSGMDNPFSIPLIEKGQKYISQMGGAATQRTLGQVFLDSQPLDEVDRLEQLEGMPGTWMAANGGETLFVHFPLQVIDLADHTIELTQRKSVFRPDIRGLGYISLCGFILEHAANQALTSFWEKGSAPQQGLVSCRSGHHWVIENNVIRYAKSIGLDVGSEGRLDELDGQPTPGLVGYHRIAGNTISDNGQGGICGLGHIGTEIIGNSIERNNSLGAIAWEEAAIKTHFFIHGRIEGNLIRNNFCNGIWLDNVYQDIRVSRNVILNNQGAGIFCEMGGGPCLIDNNVIALQTQGDPEMGGNGIYAHDAGGITVAHNFLAQNANFGVFMQIAVERYYNVYPPDMTSFEQPAIDERPCHCRDQRIYNNIFVENHRGAVNLPYPAEKAGNMTCDHNLYNDWGGAGLFAVNSTAGARLEEIIAAWRLAQMSGRADPHRHLLEASQLKPPSFAPLSTQAPSPKTPADFPEMEPALLRLGKHIYMSFSSWQALLGMDHASAAVLINNISWQLFHPGPGPWLTFQIDHLGHRPYPGSDEIERDFYGRQIPQENPSPGPFQAITGPGPYHFRLWPIGEGRDKIEP